MNTGMKKTLHDSHLGKLFPLILRELPLILRGFHPDSSWRALKTFPDSSHIFP